MKAVYEGTLFGWFETGLEGVVWALQQDGVDGYDGLVTLQQGDCLEVHSPDKQLLFSGTVEPDYDIGRQCRPGTTLQQQSAAGYWVHWLQSGVEQEDWVAMFMAGDNRGELLRGEDGE